MIPTGTEKEELHDRESKEDETIAYMNIADDIVDADRKVKSHDEGKEGP